MKTLAVLLAAAAAVALPFLFRPAPQADAWRPGDPVVVIITPHNEAIRYEFGRAFSRWHAQRFGRPVKVDWRVIGGTTEIGRYLESEIQSSFRGWWSSRENRPWPRGGTFALTDHRATSSEADPALTALRQALRSTDDPTAFGTGIDLFFGGGEFDHSRAFAKGLTVEPWPAGIPAELLRADDGTELIPEQLGGERWRGAGFIGTALSTFGIVYNADRLADLGLATPPGAWIDLTASPYRGRLGLADPTKSGSIAKAFEMIIHQCIHEAVEADGFSGRDELSERAHDPAFTAAIERGWINGLNRIRLIGANARYFTDSAGKVPIDVSTGDAAAGIAIDFYGRYQAETSRDPVTGQERMRYVTPQGGSSVSCDPISLLRGAPHRALAVRFIEFTVGTDGQRLWNYRPGTPGGPEKFALRRLPIRRDFYPSDCPAIQARYEAHRAFTSDPLGDPGVDPYQLAAHFTYIGRWTGRHFGIHRDLIRAMCLDSGDELRAAWDAIARAGGPAAAPEAMAALCALPPGLTWQSALDPQRYGSEQRMDYLREWTLFFRAQYREARRLAENAR